MSYLMELKNVSASYGAVKVLERINLQIAAGICIGLVGEHGAGKSSLAKLICGLVRPASGDILVEGETIASYDERYARSKNVQMVQQKVELLDNFSVAHNIFANRLSSSSPFILDTGALIRQAKAILDKWGVVLDPYKKCKELNLSDRVIVNILSKIILGPRLLILDESLEQLNSASFQIVTDILKSLGSIGLATIIITHKINDIYNLINQIVILKYGSIIIDENIKDVDSLSIIKTAYTQMLETEKQGNNSELEAFFKLIKYNQAILYNLPIVLVIVDQQLVIKLINKQCKEYFSCGNSLINEVLWELTAIGSELRDEIAAAVGSKKLKYLYNREIHVSGRARIANIIVCPIYDAQVLIGSILLFQDVTAHEELKNQLIISDEFASIGLLAASMAHQINNPLEIALNNISYVRKNRTNTDVDEVLKTTECQIEGIATIISSLVEFSHPRTNGTRSINLYRLIFEMTENISIGVKKKGIKIDFLSRSRTVYH